MPGPRAIVAGHGAFPDGIVSAATQITGLGDALLPFSNTGLGREEIESGLREQIVRHQIGVIFTDLHAGSVTLAARRVMREFPELVLVTGTNLATLIDFLFRDDAASPAELAKAAEAAAARGRSVLGVVTGTPPSPSSATP